MKSKSFLAVLLLLIGAGWLWSQDGEEKTWGDFLQTQIDYEPDPNGDTVGRFVESLQSKWQKLNVVVEDEAREFQLPGLKFKGIPLRGALTLIQQVSNDQISVQIDSMEEGSEYNMVFIRFNHDIQEPLTTRVISVAELIKAMDKESFLSAFEEGFEFMGQGARVPEMRFHEKTGLLFIKGSSQQVEFAQEIVHELLRGAGLTDRLDGSGSHGGGGGMDGGGGQDSSVRPRWLLGVEQSVSGAGLPGVGGNTVPPQTKSSGDK